MKMTPALVVIGALLVFWSSVFVAVILPAQTMKETADPNYWRPWNAAEDSTRLFRSSRRELLPWQ